ncbi:MAG: phytanoyl-CoA dioxygenase family protein, partial [Bacilli bacterium]
MLLVDASRLVPLSDEQVQFYHENGYIILKQGCHDELIDKFNNHIYDIRKTDPMPEWAKTDDDKRFSLRMFNPHQHDSFSLQMMKLPVVRGALAQLMDDEAVGVQSMYFFKEPGSPGQAAHQDFYYIKDDPMTMVAAWIAMEDVDVENGCLWVIPGTHNLGLLPHGEVKNL